MELIKVKYVGCVKKWCVMPGYSGHIEPGKSYPTTKENYEKELKKNDNWKLEESKSKKETIKKQENKKESDQ